MSVMLADKKVAILTADGFDEHQMTEIQRALVKAKAQIKTVAAEPGVVNGWQGDTWGHHFHVDCPMGETLGSDFDMLVMPGGKRSVDKLKLNPHTKRIINHFLDAGKPVTAIGDSVALLALGTAAVGSLFAAPAEYTEELKAAGITLSENAQEVDENIFTSNGEDLTAWVEGALAFFAEAEQVKRAA
jgi:protease I